MACLKAIEPWLVGRPAASSSSLTRSGTPAKRPGSSRRLIRSSMTAAALRAPSASNVTIGFSFDAAIAASEASRASAADTSPRRIASANEQASSSQTFIATGSIASACVAPSCRCCPPLATILAFRNRFARRQAMAGPLKGIKVVEMGLWVAGPSCAALLADWGADVIKIEPPAGDPFRGLFASALGAPAALNPPFELDNRGKRGIVLDLEKEEARKIALQLIEQADVFVTNNRPRVLEQYGMDYVTLHAKFPRLIYGQVTGYGPDGDARDTAAYDIGAFWSQAGVAMSLTAPGGAIPQQRGGMGDHMTGQMCAGAVCPALFHRERTGQR